MSISMYQQAIGATRPADPPATIHQPGKRCLNCGKDISRRQQTDYCVDCTVERRKKAEKDKRIYVKRLIERDTAKEPEEFRRMSSTGDKYIYYLVCPECFSILNKYDAFCRRCGQRLMEVEDGY